MTRSNAGEHDFDEQIGVRRTESEPFTNIFKKSEHDEIMEAIKGLREEIAKIQGGYPYISYPCPCPYPTDPWNLYPYPYPYIDRIWVDGDTGHTRYGCYVV